MPEIVTVLVGGTVYSGWKKVALHASFKKAARGFSLSIAAEGGGAAAAAMFQLGTAVSIYANSDLVVTGYVNARRPHLDPKNAYIVIAGRSKAQDAIDCSAVHPTGSFQQQTPLQILQALDKFGIGFTADRHLDPVNYQLTPGETLFDVGEGLLRDQAMTLFGQPDGSVKITDATSASSHASGLFEGQNVEVWDGDFNDGARHSVVHAHGQAAKGHGDSALRMKAEAKDAAVARYRPKIIVHDGAVTQQHLQTHANHHRNRAAGNAVRASAKTPFWRDQAGTLWTPGNLVWSESPFLALAQNMLIESFDFEQESADPGTSAVLHLVDPQAFGGQSGKSNGSGAGWGF